MAVDGLSQHNFAYFIAWLFILIALLWIIGLSGAQTGSSTSVGAGSLSSINPDGDPNSNYEVFVEAISIVLIAVAMGILTYYYTKTKIASDLIAKGYGAAAIEVDGDKNINKDQLNKYKKDEIAKLMKEVGPPPMQMR